MELRSGRRLRRSSPPPPPTHRTASRMSMDRISALPDEILLLVLARLRCVRTAVQTSLLSRRWHGLWTGLTDLTFRGLSPTRTETLLGRFTASPEVSTLDIGLPRTYVTTDANSLLRAAARLSPRHLVFTLKEPYTGYMADVELPCFQGTTSVELDTWHFNVKPLPAGEFTALESLSVTADQVSDLGSLLNRCPRLRLLSVSYPDNRPPLRITLPPAREFPTLERLSLSGRIVDLGSFLNRCRHLRVLKVTQLDTCLLRIAPPPSGEFSMIEELSLSGNIANLGTLLSQCPRLRVLGVTFRGMVLRSLEVELAALEEAVPFGLMLSFLEIGIPWGDNQVDAASYATLLRAATRLSPKELVFSDNIERCDFTTCHGQINEIKADLPCFPHATSIEMSLKNVCFARLLSGEFSALERLSLSGRYGIVEIGTLVSRCPRLRVLKVTVATGKITVHSSSLQELDVSHRDIDAECHGIDIVTPVLKQLRLEVNAGCRDIGVSISSPLVEKVWWQCSYTAVLALAFGPWRLQSMSVQTIERSYVRNMDATCSHILCLNIYASNDLGMELNFAQEIEKLPVANFFVLELNFKSHGHVYGALVLQLLQTRWIRTTIKHLKVVLPWFQKAKRACERDCPCDEPKNWRSESIFCTTLEVVEISGYNGEDHENDFLRSILKCSPMLKSVTMRPWWEFRGFTTELSSFSLAYPSVKFYR